MKILKNHPSSFSPLKLNLGLTQIILTLLHRKKEKLEKRFETWKTIVGTKKYHCFMPKGNKKMRVQRFSKSTNFDIREYCVDIQDFWIVIWLPSKKICFYYIQDIKGYLLFYLPIYILMYIKVTTETLIFLNWLARSFFPLH